MPDDRTSAHISELESHLSQSLNVDQCMSLEKFSNETAAQTHHSTKERQIHKFQYLKNQRPATHLQPLDLKKLVINLSQRPLSTPEEVVLSLGLSFAITPEQIPYQEIIHCSEVGPQNGRCPQAGSKWSPTTGQSPTTQPAL